jgi:hypothetical protein
MEHESAPAKWRPKESPGRSMTVRLRKPWIEEQDQDIVEYAVMLAVILVIGEATIRLIGSSANNVFSSVGSSVQ